MRLLFLAFALALPLSGCYWDDRPDGLDPDRAGDIGLQDASTAGSQSTMSPTMPGGSDAASEALGNAPSSVRTPSADPAAAARAAAEAEAMPAPATLPPPPPPAPEQ